MGRFGRLLLHLALDFGTFGRAGRLVAGLSVVWDGLGGRRKPQWPKCVHWKRNNKRVLRSEKKHFFPWTGVEIVWKFPPPLFHIFRLGYLSLFFVIWCLSEPRSIETNRRVCVFTANCAIPVQLLDPRLRLKCDSMFCLSRRRSECDDWYKQLTKRLFVM